MFLLQKAPQWLWQSPGLAGLDLKRMWVEMLQTIGECINVSETQKPNHPPVHKQLQVYWSSFCRICFNSSSSRTAVNLTRNRALVSLAWLSSQKKTFWKKGTSGPAKVEQKGRWRIYLRSIRVSSERVQQQYGNFRICSGCPAMQLKRKSLSPYQLNVKCLPAHILVWTSNSINESKAQILPIQSS